jgi:amino acid transporter
LIWGWVVVTFFTWFVGIAMAEICSSFPVYILISCIYIYMFVSNRVPLPLFTPRN